MDSGVAKVDLPSSTVQLFNSSTGEPSMARPVSLVLLDPKMKATNSAENAIHLDTSMAKPTPKDLSRRVERGVHSECLGASVERPV